MSLHDYIEKLRAKPVRERERIAVIATAVGFLVILVIWVVSFNEMNKSSEPQADQTSASLNDLKNNFQTGKDSIQNMMQQLPSQAGAAATDATNGADNSASVNSTGSVLPSPAGNLPAPSDSTANSDNSQNIDNNPSAGTNDNQPPSGGNAVKNNPSKPAVPQLP